MYAIIQTGGEQIRVSAGDKVCVEKIKGDVNSEIVLDKVLMVSKDDKIVCGKPYIEGASVKAEIVETGKTAKVLVFGPRPKKTHRKLRGHRQQYTTLKIKEIIGG
ncbi:MAG: 50S ribosomal protein L21 [Nitrospirae bacterium]|jgi:large subunit ribosomal protein L21|nr:50S ribosomal protein L21 [Nitrospirota bacterium]MCL5062930.1 50S ribosomal protein L21 [Nitrospirota bacterium]MDA8215350.1 50S ribosomal protein L21 [Nitrospiraceae bacterium]MDA8337944.1 50S ribosomal protein L21 [Nitrospiraceae bacterium]